MSHDVILPEVSRAPNGAEAAAKQFVAKLLRQLSAPSKQEFRVRTAGGVVTLTRGEALRMLRVARQIVRLCAARRRTRLQ